MLTVSVTTLLTGALALPIPERAGAGDGIRAGHTAAWGGAPEQDRALPNPGEITSVGRPEEGEHVLKARLLTTCQPFPTQSVALFCFVFVQHEGLSPGYQAH